MKSLFEYDYAMMCGSCLFPMFASSYLDRVCSLGDRVTVVRHDRRRARACSSIVLARVRSLALARARACVSTLFWDRARASRRKSLKSLALLRAGLLQPYVHLTSVSWPVQLVLYI